MKYVVVGLLILLSSTGVPAGVRNLNERLVMSKILLKENWRIQSSAKVQEKGEAISRQDYRTAGWYPASVPSTVVGTLVENKVYPEPYFGMNLRTFPGCSYPIGTNFSNLPMPEDSPFRRSWWYRTEFQIPASERGQRLRLHFDGINFRANIWLNGQQIANSKEVAGTFRLFEFDVTDVAHVGQPNVLAVEIFAPQQDDLALTWVDWNPTPPDKNMGLWHDVYITSGGPVALRFPQVITHFDSASLELAQLTINAEVRNTTAQPVSGTLNGRIEGIRFSQPVSLGPQETKQVTFTPQQFPQLNLKSPRLWWPTQMGQQNLYDLELTFETGGRISDQQSSKFGIREISSEVDKDGHRVFKVNGRKILIRGGGWSPDMLLRYRPERLEDEFRYVRDMHLNTIRLEGKLESDYFYELADRYGILIMAGWCCCDHWEHWQHRDDYKTGPTWDQEDYDIAARSQSDQVRRLRSHPSLLVWLNGSDNPPPPDVEKMYISILEKYHWPNPYLSSATAKVSQVTGVSGVKMEGPYEWVPPNYWLLDKNHGGAHGFATEISPGPAVPPLESIRRMLPEEHLWPINEYWNYHSGGGQFKTLKVFTDALNGRYGPAKDVEDYAKKAQLMAYEGQRAMFEGYARNKYTSGGVIQWMLNNAWPSMIWHLYDYYLRPAGGYFGTKKACEPLHIQYSYDDRSIVAVNNTHQALKQLKVTAKVFDLNLSEKFTRTTTLDLPADTNISAFTVPAISDSSPTYFLKLTLEEAGGRLISSNFYWLSTKDDVLDWKKSTWYYTPTQSYADFTQLQNLPPVLLKASSRTTRSGEDELAHVTVENTGRHLALFVRLQIRRGPDGEEVLPVLWEDNYFPLMPGEKREVTVSYRTRDMEGAQPVLALSGWNVTGRLQPLSTSSKH